MILVQNMKIFEEPTSTTTYGRSMHAIFRYLLQVLFPQRQDSWRWGHFPIHLPVLSRSHLCKLCVCVGVAVSRHYIASLCLCVLVCAGDGASILVQIQEGWQTNLRSDALIMTIKLKTYILTASYHVNGRTLLQHT